MRCLLRSWALCLALLCASPTLAQAGAGAAEPVQPPPAPQAAEPAPAPPAADAGFDARLDQNPYEQRPSWANEPAGGESLLGAVVKTLLVLGLVLALVYLSLNFGLRKLMRVGTPANAVVKLHQRVALEPKKTLVLVEAAGEFLLVGVGEHEVSLVARLDAEKTREALARSPEPPAASATSRPFWERLIVKPPPKGPTGGT